jgi:hypothetical protein
MRRSLMKRRRFDAKLAEMQAREAKAKNHQSKRSPGMRGDLGKMH